MSLTLSRLRIRQAWVEGLIPLCRLAFSQFPVSCRAMKQSRKLKSPLQKHMGRKVIKSSLRTLKRLILPLLIYLRWNIPSRSPVKFIDCRLFRRKHLNLFRRPQHRWLPPKATNCRFPPSLKTELIRRGQANGRNGILRWFLRYGIRRPVSNVENVPWSVRMRSFDKKFMMLLIWRMLRKLSNQSMRRVLKNFRERNSPFRSRSKIVPAAVCVSILARQKIRKIRSWKP